MCLGHLASLCLHFRQMSTAGSGALFGGERLGVGGRECSRAAAAAVSSCCFCFSFTLRLSWLLHLLLLLPF